MACICPTIDIRTASESERPPECPLSGVFLCEEARPTGDVRVYLLDRRAHLKSYAHFQVNAGVFVGRQETKRPRTCSGWLARSWPCAAPRIDSRIGRMSALPNDRADESETNDDR